MALRRIVFVAVMLISIAFPISSIAVACDIKGDFRCESFWKYQFDLGYEFVSIDKMFQEAFPRTGLQIYQAYVKSNGQASSPKGVDFFANFRLTSSAETTAITTTGTPNTSSEGKKALEGDIQFFIPFEAGKPKIRNFGNRSKTAYIGPTITIGGKKTDDNDDVEGRYYGGLRFALDTDHYFDILGGFTERTDSTRLELRGQMPIARISLGGGDSMLHLGAIGNFGVTSDNGKGNDVVRIYISWGIDPEKILTILQPVEEEGKDKEPVKKEVKNP